MKNKQNKQNQKEKHKTKQNKTQNKTKHKKVGTSKSNIKIAEIKCEKMPRLTYNRVLFLNLIHT